MISPTKILAIMLFPLLLIQASDNQQSEIFSGPGTFKILNQKESSIIIPFRMHKGKPVMDVEINGEKATLMIDNGVLWDDVWLFGSPLVEKLQLQSFDGGLLYGSGEGDPTQIYKSTNITIKFDDIIFYEQPVLVSPPQAGFADMFPGADGQLCNTFFKHFIVEFDFVNNNVVLHKPHNFKYNGNGSILKMSENSNGGYMVPFSFETLDNKVYTDQVDIDFGGIYNLKIALGNNHNIQLPENIESAYSAGAQGKSTEYKGKIKSYTIGDYTKMDPVVVFGDSKTSRIHPKSLGVIGLPLFMKFNTVFDYINNYLYLIPIEKPLEPK